MTNLFIDRVGTSGLLTWIAWILLHTLWQGGVTMIVLWGVLRVIRITRSEVRYGLACLAMLSICLAPVVTGVLLRNLLRTDPQQSTFPVKEVAHEGLPNAMGRDDVFVGADPLPQPQTQPREFARVEASHANGFTRHQVTWASFRDFVNRNAAFVVAGWLVGVVFFASRLFWSFRAVHILRKSCAPITDSVLSQRFAGLLQRLNLDARVQLMQSASICVPTALGWLRPIVLLPLACTSRLSVDQVEAILAHELAHIKRHDYLVNVMQSFIETILFYHPAVWWISNVIRSEREHCCDAMALRLIADRDLYASSLMDLARLTAAPQLALSASGGNLKERIRRILNIPTSTVPASGPVIALTIGFLLAICLAAACLSHAGAEDVKTEQTVASKNDADNDKEPPKAKETQPANDSTPASVEKAVQKATPRWQRHGRGVGGAEIFSNIELLGLQKELGLNEQQIANIQAICDEYRSEVVANVPFRATRSRQVRRDGWQTMQREATRAGMLFFKAGVTKFRPKLKGILTADQFTRLQQITWQDMGAAALADDEIIRLLQITKEQQRQIDAIYDEYDALREAIAGNVPDAAPTGFPGLVSQRDEMEKKIREALSDDQFNRFTALKGKPFENRRRSPPSEPRTRPSPEETWVKTSGRGAAFELLIETPAVQQELTISPEELDKLKGVSDAFKTAVKVGVGQRPELEKMSQEEKAEAEEKARKIKSIESDKYIANLKATLSEEQFTRLQQIYWQRHRSDALFDSEMIKALPVSDELLKKLKTIQSEFDETQKKVSGDARKRRGTLESLDDEEEEKVAKVLTQTQLDQFTALLGTEFKLDRAMWDHAINEDAARRVRMAERGERRSPQTSRAISRRGLLSLIENPAIHDELRLTEGEITRIRVFGDEARAAVSQAEGLMPDFEKLSDDERRLFKERLLKIDQEITDQFYPKLKSILTADQYRRFQQIRWQVVTMLNDPELMDALSLSKEQRDKLDVLNRESLEERKTKLDDFKGVVSSANVNTIFENRIEDSKDRQERSAYDQERLKAWQDVQEKYRKAVDEILTGDQREKFATLKGKAFDRSLLAR